MAYLLQETKPPNAADGIYLLEKAIDLSFAEAAVFLGRSYYTGEHLIKDESAGLEYLLAASSLGE